MFGRGKRILPTDGKRKRVRIAPEPCRNVRSEYRVRRNGIKVSDIVSSPHKNGAEGETDREADEIKRRNGKNEGIRRQRAKNDGRPTCERLPASAEKKVAVLWRTTTSVTGKWNFFRTERLIMTE